MHQTFRLIGAAIVAVAFTYVLGTATAQTTTKQIKLTEKQVEGYIAAQKKMAEAKADAELESIAKKHGFASLDEYDDVGVNIMMIVNGIDPEDKSFTEPPAQIKKRIEGLNAELKELSEALKTAQPIQYPANVELIKKHFDKIQAVLP